LYGLNADCEECYYLDRGACKPLDNTSCNCFVGYEGSLCRSLSVTTPTTLQSLSTTNWTVIIAVVSSVAGLLLIISLVMCICFIVSKYRRSPTASQPTANRQQFTIPRVHIPTLGTGNLSLNGFSLDNTYDEQYVDASDSFPSSSNTTYNTTYRTNGNRPEANFGIFDELENRIPLSRGHIPRPQMVNILGTLNSLPGHDHFDDPSGEASTFSDSRDLDEVEMVTDMLDDMTRDDEIADEFVEALNPNLAIPRLTLEPEIQSSGWLSVCFN
jgi:hypothetical protein